MDSNGGTSTSAKITPVQTTTNLSGGRGSSSAEEQVKALQKILKDSQSQAKEKHRQVFQLSCQLKQENDKLRGQLAAQEKVRNQLLAECSILKEGLQFINGQLIKTMESLANFGVGGGSGGIEVKLNISGDDLGGSGGGEMYSNPKSYFAKQLKNLEDIYTSKLNGLKEEREEMEKRAKNWEGRFIKLILDIKEGSLAKKRKREVDSNCDDRENKSFVLVTENKVETKEDQLSSHGNEKEDHLIKAVGHGVEGTNLTYAKAASQVIKTLEATKVTGQGQGEETGRGISSDGTDDNFDIDDHQEFPTIETAMLSWEPESESLSSLASEEEGEGLDRDSSCSNKVETETETTLRKSPRRRKKAKGSGGEYGCPMCEETFYSTFGLTTHLGEKHKNVAGLLGKDSSSLPRKKAKKRSS